MRGYHIRLTFATSAFQSVPKDLFAPLPAQAPKSTARKSAVFNSTNKDYRYGPIRIDWLDVDHTMPNTSGNLNVWEKEERFSSGGGGLSGSGGPTMASFVQHTKSGSMNLPQGKVHLYRDVARKPSLSAGEETTIAAVILANNAEQAGDDVLLGVLAVPSWMTPSDLLAFVAPAAEGITHIRVIRDSLPNRSMAVIKFSKAADAAEFATEYNGKLFNSMQHEVCQVVHVLSIETADVNDALASPPNAYELPICPVCLERMDSTITGLITIPCAHTFHCACLSKWGDSRCPVCRYSQTLLRSANSLPGVSSSSSSSYAADRYSACADCGVTSHLWICLICGNVGCGRYDRAHAHAHYSVTTHLYALELETQRVWDYAGDGYVHRLIQNKADGKLVELPSAAASTHGAGGAGREGGGLGPSAADVMGAEKIEAIGLEYSYLLTSQLDSQRAYYEQQHADLLGKLEEMRVCLESQAMELAVERVAIATKKEEIDLGLEVANRERVKAEKRAERTAELARKFEREMKEERAVGAELLKNLQLAKAKAEAVDKERAENVERVRELEEQLRDVMFFLDAKDKIESGGGIEAEAAGGSVEVPAVSKTKRTRQRKRG